MDKKNKELQVDYPYWAQAQEVWDNIYLDTPSEKAIRLIAEAIERVVKDEYESSLYRIYEK